MSEIEWERRLQKRLAFDREILGKGDGVREQEMKVMSLMPRSELVRLVKDREAEFVAHVQIAPPPPDGRDADVLEDPYQTFDIDREQVDAAVARTLHVAGYYAEIDAEGGRKTVILGKCLSDEQRHLCPRDRNAAIDILLFREAELRGRLAVEVERLRDQLATLRIACSEAIEMARDGLPNSAVRRLEDAMRATKGAPDAPA